MRQALLVNIRSRLFVFNVMMCVLAAAALSAPEDRFQGGSYDGWDRNGMTNATGMGYTLVTLSSGTNQVFGWVQSPAILLPLSIMVETPGDMLTNNGTFCIGLPPSFEIRFDTNSTMTYSGSAAGKVGAAIFIDAGRTIRIPVTANFAANDKLVVSGLALTNLEITRPVTDRLVLDVSGDGSWGIVDFNTLQLRVSWPGGSRDGWCSDATSLYAGLLFRGTFFKAR